MRMIDKFLQAVLIVIIRFYRYSLSYFFPSSCRFEPSCSEYAISALRSYGVVKGSWLTIKRLSRCHPFHPGGYDPIK
ncbi:MAG TPA: membrane protein insertion efficiency factor YidD [candidate division Zixibacteria bacterium]